MRSIASAVLFGASWLVVAGAPAAPERPGDELRGAARPAASRAANPAVTALLDAAERELAAGRPEPAGLLLERALRIEPSNPTLWHYLGAARLELGDFEQAEAMAAKSRSLTGGDRALRARNGALTAAAARALGRPAPATRDEFPSAAASFGAADTRLDPAVSFIEVEAEPERAPRELKDRRGECWVWLPGNGARRQPASVRCDALNGYVPADAIVIRRRSAEPRERAAADAERRSYDRPNQRGWRSL